MKEGKRGKERERGERKREEKREEKREKRKRKTFNLIQRRRKRIRKQKKILIYQYLNLKFFSREGLHRFLD